MTTVTKKNSQELKKKDMLHKKNSIMLKQSVRVETFILTHTFLYNFLVFLTQVSVTKYSLHVYVNEFWTDLQRMPINVQQNL